MNRSPCTAWNVAPSAAVDHACRVLGTTIPVPISSRVVSAPIAERITSACLMSHRSDSHTRRYPSASASTPSWTPWAGVRPSVSRSYRSGFELTAPAMMNALMSSATGASSVFVMKRPYYVRS